MEIITESSQKTADFGAKVAADLKKTLAGKKVAVVIGLVGDLGSGKTTFSQGFAKGLGVTSKVISPTFILFRTYDFSGGKLYHVDLYRLEEQIKDEMSNIGLFDVFAQAGNIVLVEWAEKAKELLPKDTIWFEFSHLGENKRKIVRI